MTLAKGRSVNPGRDRAQAAMDILLCWVFGEEIVLLTLRTFAPAIAFPLAYGIFAGCLFFCWPLLLRSVTPRNMLFFLVWTALLLASVLALPKEKGTYIGLVVRTCLTCYPMFYIGRSCRTQCAYLDKLPYIASVCVVASLLASRGRIYMDEAYSQSFGYAQLPAFCVSVGGLKNGKKPQLVNIAVLSVGILSCGARGPLLCAGLGLLLILFGDMELKNWRSWGLLGAAVLAAFYLYSNYTAVLLWFSEIFERQGMSLRTLRALMNQNFFASSGRDALAEISFSQISKYPFTGVGIFKDRQWLAKYALKSSEASSVGSYPHNLFLEWYLQFGVILGTLITLVFLVLLARRFFSARKDKPCHIMFMTLVVIGVFPLMVSGSYINWQYFYLLLGFVFSDKFSRGAGHAAAL